MVRDWGRERSGFTLVELMIVVAIVGVMASIAIPVFQKYTINAKLSEGPINIKALSDAQVAYYNKPRVDTDGSDLSPCVLEWPIITPGLSTISDKRPFPGSVVFNELGFFPGEVYMTYNLRSYLGGSGSPGVPICYRPGGQPLDFPVANYSLKFGTAGSTFYNSACTVDGMANMLACYATYFQMQGSNLKLGSGASWYGPSP